MPKEGDFLGAGCVAGFGAVVEAEDGARVGTGFRGGVRGGVCKEAMENV